MNYERYIASRINKTGDRSFSGMIVKIGITTVALSMMVMIITTNVITGFKHQIAEKVFNFWGHIHITDGLAGDSFELVPLRVDAAFLDTLRSIKTISYARPRNIRDYDHPPPLHQSKGGIAHVESFTIVPAIVAYKTQFEGLLLKGLSRDYDRSRIDEFMRDGEFINFSDSIASRDMVISQHTADRMNFEVGQKVNVNFIIEEQSIKRQFIVSGIYKTGLDEYDRRFALIDMRVLQQLLGWQTDQVSGLEVFIDDIDDINLINDFIYFELIPLATSSETITQKFYQIFEWLQLQDINESVINILMILVALINMATALLIFVLERTRMIGILKALGATNWSIRKIFLLTAAKIIVQGMVIGNVIGISLCLIQKYTGVLKLREADYYLSEVPIEFNIMSMVWINLGTVVVVFLFMLIPSLIVSQISPVKTIQFN